MQVEARGNRASFRVRGAGFTVAFLRPALPRTVRSLRAALIPRGFVATYKDVAKWINCKSARPIGGALRCNRYMECVPCHRVVASDLRLGGFCGTKDSKQVSKKKKLLEKEGVTFQENGRIDEASVIREMRLSFDRIDEKSRKRKRE